jgi:hypothetical protein
MNVFHPRMVMVNLTCVRISDMSRSPETVSPCRNKAALHAFVGEGCCDHLGSRMLDSNTALRMLKNSSEFRRNKPAVSSEARPCTVGATVQGRAIEHTCYRAHKRLALRPAPTALYSIRDMHSTYARSRRGGGRSLDCLELLSRKHPPIVIGRTDSWQRVEVSDKPQPSDP